MTHPFDGARAKLDRAERHLNVLEEKIGAYLGPHLYAILKQPDINQRKYVFRAHFNRQIPTQYWGLLVGDCVHNIRCALDYVAWELAEAETGPDPNDRRTLFPVFDDPKLFKKHGIVRIRRLSNRAQAMIQRLQPYNRRNPLHDPLRLLEELNSSDKHKLLTFTTYIAKNAIFAPHVPPGYVVSGAHKLRLSGRLEEGTEVAVLEFVSSPEGYPSIPPEFQVNVDFDASIDIGLRGSPSNPSRYYLVLPALRDILRHARQIVRLFARYYDGAYSSPRP